MFKMLKKKGEKGGGEEKAGNPRKSGNSVSSAFCQYVLYIRQRPSIGGYMGNSIHGRSNYFTLTRSGVKRLTLNWTSSSVDCSVGLTLLFSRKGRKVPSTFFFLDRTL